MSIATVQKQLSLSQVGPIALAPYFTQLCDSLGASMIRDHDQLSIEVQSDASAVEGEVSVSLGLIVTELVINALKHAFPGDRHGKIKVGYQSRGADWTLTVSDDGVGMAGGAAVATPGLGTSIVEALAHQLQAKIVVSDAHPGTNVSIIFSKSAGGLDEPRGPAA
jgi:two-component sensor histidine kinase